jgi:hypothetical protein
MMVIKDLEKTGNMLTYLEEKKTPEEIIEIEQKKSRKFYLTHPDEFSRMLFGDLDIHKGGGIS